MEMEKFKLNVDQCKHVGTYENDNGYCEIYSLNVLGSVHLFAGSPTNNTILPIFDHNGKWVVVGVHNFNSYNDALIELTERFDQIENF